MRLTRPARITAATAAVLLCAGLVACGSDEEPTPTPTTPPTPTETASPATTPTTTSPTETPTSEETAPPTTRATETTGTTVSSTSRRGVPDDVAEVQKIFRSVAPDSLFSEFESCNDSGINNAWECSGPEVGQFQFFQSMSKAASTTQLITELRSSRVVEDTGRKVVGWSTLGTTAVITVVDNEEGLVMQQMVSSDRVDPQERIYELGLAEPPTSETEEPEEDNAET
ncbi:hypothetical protein [Corynebacterium sp.]|uniref:hypothetical protein n=1 Tax=Corynebacterium sp. TaxID=1720 RepID=UPI0026DF338A|nr:hypothetical protein [Corynebacterium sp.]MDO5512257.1 hypothetical protein [Corynebacterium sp.]